MAARGNFYVPELLYEPTLKLTDVLAGETLGIVYELGKGQHGLLELIKLDTRRYLVKTGNSAVPQGTIYSLPPFLAFHRLEEVNLPSIGRVMIRGVRFKQPSTFHYALDMGLLKNYRRVKVQTSIFELYTRLGHLVPQTMSAEDLAEILNMASTMGVSTFCIRQIIDALTTNRE